MGINADKVREYFAGPLGLSQWVVSADGTRVLRGIQNPHMRDWVISTADQLCGDYFWTRPAAKANRYHPEVSCGDGGLVRHTLYACYWGTEQMRAMDEYPPGVDAWGDTPTVHHDEVIASLILHDMMKEGDPQKAHLAERTAKVITGCHGVDMAEAILLRVFNGQVPSREYLHIILAIAGHMGNWTIPAKHRPDRISDPESRLVATMVHLADYAASRKCDGVMSYLLSPGKASKTEPAREKT